MDAYTDFLLVDWYMFPLCVQKIWPTIMAGAQEPVQLTGIGSIACTRQAFHNVRCTIKSIILRYLNVYFELIQGLQ